MSFNLQSNFVPRAYNLLKLGAIKNFSLLFVIRLTLHRTKSHAFIKSTATMSLSFKSFATLTSLVRGCLRFLAYHLAEASISHSFHRHFRFPGACGPICLSAKKCLSLNLSRIGCLGPYDRSFAKFGKLMPSSILMESKFCSSFIGLS